MVEMPAGSEPSYLLDCLTDTDNIHEMTEEQLLEGIKRHAVLQRAIAEEDGPVGHETR